MDAIQRINSALRTSGVLVYDQAAHPGTCKAPYVVARRSGTGSTIASRYVQKDLFEVICYVPLDRYQELAAYKKGVRNTLRSIADQVKPTGREGSDMIEPDYRAHSCVLEYQVLKRMEG